MSKATPPSDELLNTLCDTDSLWGGLLFLRPQRHEPVSPARFLLVSASFSFFYGMCANAVFALCEHLGGRPALPVYAAPLLLAVLSEALGVFFARAWNRRAEQLSRRLQWIEATRAER